MRAKKAFAGQLNIAHASAKIFPIVREKTIAKAESLFWIKLTWILTYFIYFPITRIFQRVKIKIEDSFYNYDFEPDRPLIIISNHKSVFDPWLISSVIPFKVFLKLLPIRVMGAVKFSDPMASFFRKIGLVKIIYFFYGVVPFEKEWTFEQKLEPLIDCLRRGERVMIFPEGGINRQDGINPFRRGIVYLQENTDAEIFPLAIKGRKENDGKLSVTIGAPFKIPDEVLRSENPNDEFFTNSCEFARKKVEKLYRDV